MSSLSTFMTNYARLIKQLRVKLDLDGIRYQYIFRCTVSFARVCVSIFNFPSVIMVAATASLLSVRPVATRSAVHRPACRTRVVCAAARPEVSYRSRISRRFASGCARTFLIPLPLVTQANQQKSNKVAQFAAAGLAAAVLMAQSPVFAAESYTNAKQRICASNPSAKVCRVNSFQPKK